MMEAPLKKYDWENARNILSDGLEFTEANEMVAARNSVLRLGWDASGPNCTDASQMLCLLSRLESSGV